MKTLVTGRRFGMALGVLALIGGSALIAPQLAAQSREVPVMIGGVPDLDACGTLSRVAGLKRGGDNFLAVRAGPGTGYAVKAKLGPGHFVHECDSRGQWSGIVYSLRATGAKGANSDCGVGSPVKSRRAYRGSCRTGWVHRSFLRAFAG